MSFDDLDRLRFKVADRRRAVVGEVLGTGDGVTVEFQTELYPVITDSERVWVDGALQVRDTDYTTECDVGLITFLSIPADDAVVTSSYRWAAFSDEELSDVLLRFGGSIVRAAIEVITWLLADVERFLKYNFGQEGVDRSQGRAALEGLLDSLQGELGGGGPVGMVKADSPGRERLMEPFIDQPEDLLDVP